MSACGLARRVLSYGLVVLGAPAVFGCNLGKGFQDFGEDLTNPEETIIDGPGKKIADGRLTGMLVDPWGDNGPVIVGFREVNGEPHLSMQPFDGKKGCDAGNAYHCIVFNRLEGAPQLIAYLTTDEAGQTELNFVDHKCNIAYGGIKNAELPSRLFEFPPGFVVAAGNRLLDIDPFAKKTRVITDKLRFWSGAGKEGQGVPIYYVGDGQLVVLNDKREEMLRLGKDVTQVAYQATDPNLGLYLIDEGALVRYLPSRDTPPETMAKDACEVAINTFGVTYLSPCAERKLMVRDPASETVDAIDTGVGTVIFGQRRASPKPNGDTTDVVYTKLSEQDPGFVDVWLKQAGDAPRLWQRRLGQFISATLGDSPSLTAVVDSDGTYGRLIRLNAAGEKTLHPRVSVGYRVEPSDTSFIVMTDLQDKYGNMTMVDRDGNATELAKGVSINSRPVYPEIDPALDGVSDEKYYGLAALMSNVEDGTGRLNLYSKAKPKAMTALSESARIGQFEFLQNMAAIAYLDRWDSKTNTGTLVVHQTTLKADSLVSDHVVDFTELLWPYEGVLYTVKKGDDYSIWAARAK